MENVSLYLSCKTGLLGGGQQSDFDNDIHHVYYVLYSITVVCIIILQ